MERFRGGLVLKTHRLLHHSTLGSRVKTKKNGTSPYWATASHADDCLYRAMYPAERNEQAGAYRNQGHAQHRVLRTESPRVLRHPAERTRFRCVYRSVSITNRRIVRFRSSIRDPRFRWLYRSISVTNNSPCLQVIASNTVSSALHRLWITPHEATLGPNPHCARMILSRSLMRLAQYVGLRDHFQGLRV